MTLMIKGKKVRITVEDTVCSLGSKKEDTYSFLNDLCVMMFDYADMLRADASFRQTEGQSRLTEMYANMWEHSADDIYAALDKAGVYNRCRNQEDPDDREETV